MKDSTALSIDAIIGGNIGIARKDLRYTVNELCEVIERSPQQLHKYEMGQNRVSAALLMSFSKLFDKPLNWFFEAPSVVKPTDQGPDQHPDFESCLYLLKQLKSSGVVPEVKAYLAKAVAASR